MTQSSSSRPGMHSDAMHPEKLTIPNGLFKKKQYMNGEFLVGGWPTPLKNDLLLWKMMEWVTVGVIPNMEK